MEEIRTYDSGEIIFKQGEPGTSMLMIKSGSVEIFKDTPQGEVLLTVQNTGEVIGMFTFFNNGPRLASARARGRVTGQLIKKAAGQDPLSTLPKWVQVVIHEFTNRMDQMNTQYAAVLQEKQILTTKAINPLYMSTLMADGFAVLSPLKAKKIFDGREVVVVEEMLSLFESCFAMTRKDVDQIMEVFKSQGLVRIDIEPDRKQEVILLTVTQKMKWFADFVRSTRSGKNRKLLRINIPFRYRKILFAMRDYVEKQGQDPSKTYKEELDSFMTRFPEIMDMALKQEAIEAGQKIELVEIKNIAGKSFISFHPSAMARTLIALNVIQALKPAAEADGKGGDKEAS